MAPPAASEVGSRATPRTRLIGQEAETIITRSFLLEKAALLQTLAAEGSAKYVRRWLLPRRSE